MDIRSAQKKSAAASGAGRIAAVILASLVFFAVFFSALYISIETFHDCEGKNCPVCSFISQCENTLHQFQDNGQAQLSSVLLPVFVLVSLCITFLFLVKETPVLIKVRQNK